MTTNNNNDDDDDVDNNNNNNEDYGGSTINTKTFKDSKLFTEEEKKDHHRREILDCCWDKEVESHKLSNLLDIALFHRDDNSRSILTQSLTSVSEESIKFIKEMEEMYGMSFLQYANKLWRVEVRLNDVSYSVPVHEEEYKIKTVYNSGVVYLLVKLVQRLYHRFSFKHNDGEEQQQQQQQQQQEEESYGKKKKSILSHVDLTLEPGKTYLVLGPPGSGKTSLLRAIAGLLPSSSNKNNSDRSPSLEGQIHYNGISVNNDNNTNNKDNLILSNAIAFVDQIDRHAPRLTVHDTFQFAFQCKSARTHATSLLNTTTTATTTPSSNDNNNNNNASSSPQGTKTTTTNTKMDEEQFRLNAITSFLGLSHVQDTFVGNDDIRGISGGQRRRVTTGEMLMFDAPIFCGDEISTGLDAASTYAIIHKLVLMTKLLGYTRVISLLQPSPETFSLFDHVIVLSESHVIYAGPVNHVLRYFEELGFIKPEQMDVADYLQIIATCSAEDSQSLMREGEHYKYTPLQLALEFKKSRYYLRIKERLDLDQYEYDWRTNKDSRVEGSYTMDKEDEDNKDNNGGNSGITTKNDEENVPTVEQYIANSKQHLTKRHQNSFLKSTYLNLKRFITIWKRDKRFVFANIIRNVAMGISVGVVFYQTDSIDSIYGVLFQGMQFVMLGTMTSAPESLTDRQIFYKHKEMNFYPTFSYVIGRALSMLPQALMDTFLFGTIIYWMVGFYAGAGQFFIYVGIIFVFTVVMNQIFAIFTAFAATKNDVQALGACLLLLNLLFCGFIVAPNVIPNYYIWIYWWAPMAWAYRALLVNEFYSSDWDTLVNGTDVTMGEQSLISKGFTMDDGKPFGDEWVGWAFAYLLGYQVICMLVTGIVLHYVKVKKKVMSRPTKNINAKLGLTTRRLTNIASKRTNLLGAYHHDQDEQNNGEVMLASDLLSPLMSEDDNSSNNDDDTFDLPFTKVDISFHNICYEVTASTNKEKLKLLNDVNGVFRAGRMCALMGSSGAGKTTLMDVIALRKTTGTVEGEVRLNGHEQEPITFRRCSGYVEQFDVQSPQLTVRETVLFSARLRLDVRNKEDKPNIIEKYVDEIIKMLELTAEAGLLVGSDEEGGLSFEQTKRLSIAVELAASPSIIFLDEPTSGLDSRAAVLVMKSLRKIAETGRTVCATIHQPSSAVFEMFDDLLLLKKGGKSVFFGELGIQSQNLIEYFEALGATPIMQGENPATWMLTIQEGTDVPDYAQKYVESETYKELLNNLEEMKACPDEAKKITVESEYAAPRRERTNMMATRLRTIYWRSPSYNRSRLLLAIVIAFLLGSIFLYEHRPDVMDEVYISSIFSTMFLSFIVIGILAITSVLPVMLKIRDVFYRHRAAGMLSHWSVAWALGTAEKYFLMLSSALFTVVFYFTIGLEPNFPKFCAFWGFFTFNWAIYSYFGQLFMCSVRGMATAQILASIFIGINNFFSGLIVRPQFMTGFWQVTYWATPGHYVYEGLIVTQFHDDDRTVVAYVGSDFYNDLGCAPTDTEPCEGTVSQYMGTFFGGRFRYENRFYDIGVLGALLTISRLLTFFALKKLNYTST